MNIDWMDKSTLIMLLCVIITDCFNLISILNQKRRGETLTKYDKYMLTIGIVFLVAVFVILVLP